MNLVDDQARESGKPMATVNVLAMPAKAMVMAFVLMETEECDRLIYDDSMNLTRSTYCRL